MCIRDRYTTLPAVLLLGLINVCIILLPLPAASPVIPPATGPNVQLKLLGVDAVKAKAVLLVVQIVSVVIALVTTGVGFTVTVKLVALPTQLPPVDVGITLYIILPAVVLTGLVKV